MVIQFNTCRLNGTSLNSASQNSVGESLHAPVGGGGSIVPIPPTIPEEPEEPTPIPTFVLSASVSNGVVLATLNGSAISLPYEANEGDVIVLEVTPTDGFSFEGWADGVTDNPRTITMTADVVLSASCVEVVAPNKHIVFADAEVERVLMSKGVSSDGVGITKEDAERVTSLQNWFQNNNTIKTFDELRYFTNLTRLNTIPFLNCTSLQSIDLGNIIEINASAFNGCTALVQDIETEKVVGELGQGAFRYAGITSLIAPNATSCGTNLCDSCPNITKADVRGMTKIGHFAFQRCPNLVDVNISSVVQLDVQVFYECTSLKEIDVPSSVQSIGEACFFGCSAMEKCIIRATTPPTLSTRVFVNNNCIIYVPDASLEAYKTATNWNTYADRIKPLSEIEDYYVSDALLMHLDGINKGNVEGEWQDLVSGNSFVNHGAIAEADGWRFDGASSYMDSTTLINKGWWQSKRTMEVVVVFDDITPAKKEVVFMGRKNCFAFGKYLNEHFVNSANYHVTSMKIQHENNVVIYGFSLNNEKSPQGIVNGKKLVTDYSNAFAGGDANIAFLGKRAEGEHFKGKIYAIRLHDRVLTEEEILYNQRIDNKRFNLGLDI